MIRVEYNYISYVDNVDTLRVTVLANSVQEYKEHKNKYYKKALAMLCKKYDITPLQLIHQGYEIIQIIIDEN